MISRQEIDGLAELARLKLADGEKEALRNDISNILEYVEAVSTAEMPHGEALRRGQEGEIPPLYNVMRDDVPRAKDDALAGKEETLLAALPRREGDFAVVRKIIQKDE